MQTQTKGPSLPAAKVEFPVNEEYVFIDAITITAVAMKAVRFNQASERCDQFWRDHAYKMVWP